MTPLSSDRQFLGTLVPYRIHLLGFELHIEGLAFQQQDTAVGACATTAIWVALQRLIRHEGGRTPTPASITTAGVRHFLSEGRPFPSSGLSIEQISEALRSFDFGAEAFKVADPEYFCLLMNVYLRSGIPVILAVATGTELHAVTAIGYRSQPESAKRISLAKKGWAKDSHPLNVDFQELIIHDDRLGPYAVGRLKRRGRRLSLRLSWPSGKPEVLRIIMAFAPLYPKLRMNAEQLTHRANTILPIVRQVFRLSSAPVDVELFFERAGAYLRSLYGLNLSADRLANFQRTVALSRYIGVIRWSQMGVPLLDTLWDTTDKMRDIRVAEQLLGIIALNRQLESRTDAVASFFDSVAG